MVMVCSFLLNIQIKSPSVNRGRSVCIQEGWGVLMGSRDKVCL